MKMEEYGKNTTYPSSIISINNITFPTVSTTLSCDFETLHLVSSSMTNFRILAISAMALIFAVIILNGPVVIAMATVKHYRNSPSHMLLIILSVCDFGIGVVILPPYVVHVWFLSERKIFCMLSQFLKLSGYAMSSLTVLLILFTTIQLYLAIVRPFLYEHAHNKKYYLVYLTSSWLTLVVSQILCLYVFPTSWRTFKRYVASTILLAIFIVILILHTRISLEVNKLKRHATCNPSIRSNTVHKRAFLITSTIIVAFAFCYLPIASLLIYDLVNGSTLRSETYIMPLCEFAALSNAVLDPLIYCLRLKVVRLKIRRMLCFGRLGKIGPYTQKTKVLKNGRICISNVTPRQITQKNDIQYIFQKRLRTQ